MEHVGVVLLERVYIAPDMYHTFQSPALFNDVENGVPHEVPFHTAPIIKTFFNLKVTIAQGRGTDTTMI